MKNNRKEYVKNVKICREKPNLKYNFQFKITLYDSIVFL